MWTSGVRVKKEDDMYKLLRSYQDFDPNAFTHAYLVTLFSSCIIKQFEWQSKATIETTALACMFHDIGKMKLPPELLSLHPTNMSEDQLEQSLNGVFELKKQQLDQLSSTECATDLKELAEQYIAELAIKSAKDLIQRNSKAD